MPAGARLRRARVQIVQIVADNHPIGGIIGGLREEES
jgi:hypothetical protein